MTLISAKRFIHVSYDLVNQYSLSPHLSSLSLADLMHFVLHHFELFLSYYVPLVEQKHVLLSLVRLNRTLPLLSQSLLKSQAFIQRSLLPGFDQLPLLLFCFVFADEVFALLLALR